MDYIKGQMGIIAALNVSYLESWFGQHVKWRTYEPFSQACFCLFQQIATCDFINPPPDVAVKPKHV